MLKVLNRVILILVGLLFCGFFQSAGALVQITNLQDFDFGTVYPPYSGNLQQNDRVCIYNSDSDRYRITATGTHDVGTRFYLANGANTIRYRARWHGRGGGFVILDAGHSHDFRGARQELLCAGVPNGRLARLRVRIRSEWFGPTPAAGTYSDTLTLLLEPV